jgi:CubicO group peptidase (beta-lactamase class C family)
MGWGKTPPGRRGYVQHALCVKYNIVFLSRKERSGELRSWSNPVSLKDAYGGQVQRFFRAFEILKQGVAERAFPGASFAVTQGKDLVALAGVGGFTYEPDTEPVDENTIYDLASVTKAIATTAAAMILYEKRKLRLDMPVQAAIPEFAGADPRRQQVTIRMLLTHTSGLPSYLRLFEQVSDRERLVEIACRAPLATEPGTRADYSDIGFIILGELLARTAGEPLDTFCSKQIFKPLGMHNTTYNPPLSWKAHIPPTVDDLSFRKRIVRGEVHDENASILRGVAGHAGLFATAYDVARFAECLLSGGAPFVERETVELFTTHDASTPGSYALGWDTPTAPSQSGAYFSKRAYGHLGYTGTSLWIDPERQLSVTLLTNRTWQNQMPDKIKVVRPAFHDAILEALDKN